MADPEPAPAPSAGFWSLCRLAARGAASLLRPPRRAAASGVLAAETAAVDVVSADTRRDRRVPPGQVRTARWPVLHAGPTPRVDLATWSLSLTGLVEEPLSWDWASFRALPCSRVFADMHCVTRWSRLDNTWEGVLVSEVVRRARVRPEAKFVLIHAENGFTTNLALADFLGEDCLFAWSHDGLPLDADHGHPLRLVVPRLYAWKSAKWVRRIEFRADDVPGFWEENGYHNHGDPWAEERFW